MCSFNASLALGAVHFDLIFSHNFSCPCILRQYHDDKASSNTEGWHNSDGGFLKPIIFGGLDGILTSFAIVAGAAGGGMSPTVVLVLGFSNIFADALRYGLVWSV